MCESCTQAVCSDLQCQVADVEVGGSILEQHADTANRGDSQCFGFPDPDPPSFVAEVLRLPDSCSLSTRFMP